MSAPSWAVPGREVVCVFDDWKFDGLIRLGINPPDRVPMLNEVLRIRAVFDGSELPYSEDGICFLGFDGVPHLYAAINFRPVITIEDDLKAHFAHLLDATVRVSEEA